MAISSLSSHITLSQSRLMCTTILFTPILSFNLHSDSSSCTSTIYNIEFIRGTDQANMENNISIVYAASYQHFENRDTLIEQSP